MNKLFLIVKRTGKTKKPIQAFIESDFEKAKLYFLGFIWKDPTAVNYELRWIGKFQDGKLKINDVFIQAGFETINKAKNEKKTISQLKMKYDFCMNPSNPFNEKIKIMFEGDEIQ